MNMQAREMKWVAVSFFIGFLLCYLLLAAFRSQPPAPRLLTTATPNIAWPSAPVVMTNIQLPELRILGPNRWVDQMPGTPSVQSPPGYSLDLIDTRYQPPSLEEKP